MYIVFSDAMAQPPGKRRPHQPHFSGINLRAVMFAGLFTVTTPLEVSTTIWGRCPRPRVPPRGNWIGIFNSSHYESVLPQRVQQANLLPRFFWFASRRLETIKRELRKLSSPGCNVLGLSVLLTALDAEKFPRGRARLVGFRGRDSVSLRPVQVGRASEVRFPDLSASGSVSKLKRPFKVGAVIECFHMQRWCWQKLRLLIFPGPPTPTRAPRSAGPHCRDDDATPRLLI